MHRYFDAFSQAAALILSMVLSLLGIIFISLQYSVVFKSALYTYLFTDTRTASFGYLLLVLALILFFAQSQVSAMSYIDIKFPKKTISIEKDFVIAYLKRVFLRKLNTAPSFKVMIADQKTMLIEVSVKYSGESVEEKVTELESFVKSAIYDHLGIEPSVDIKLCI